MGLGLLHALLHLAGQILLPPIKFFHLVYKESFLAAPPLLHLSLPGFLKNLF